MADRAPSRSLLEFAIAASGAVVPVLLGMLLLVAVVRPSEEEPHAWRAADDRYVSARHMAALKTFEGAIGERADAAPLEASAEDVLRGLPGCSKEWGVKWRERWSARWRGGPPPVPAATHVADQLGRIDAALLRFSTEPDNHLPKPLGLDLGRWTAAAAALLGTDAESPQYPGQRFRIGCADLAGAINALARADGRMLQGLAWRGRASGPVVARWPAGQQVEITARDVMRRNPWSGLGGCIYLRAAEAATGATAATAGAMTGPAFFLAGEGSPRRQICARRELAGGGAVPQAVGGEPERAAGLDDPRWRVPPSLSTLLQPLDGLRQPSAALYHAFADADVASDPANAAPGGRNRIVVDGAPVDVGFSIDLGIDPEAQALAQQTAACYTGRHEVCRALGMRRREDGERAPGSNLLEGAMVRMAAVAIIDVASGRIEALAGTFSPCARLDAEGRPRGAGCDARLPRPPRVTPVALLNPAVYHDAMPASTIKPILASAFLADAAVGPRWLSAERAAMGKPGIPLRDSLRGELLRSDSARFLDRMFCSETGFAACTRPWAAQAMALGFGWNAGCATPRLDCGKEDLLFGTSVDAPVAGSTLPRPSTLVAYGRLMSEPSALRLGAPMHLRPAARFDPAIVRRCAAGADGRRFSDDDWEKCKGGAFVDVVAEGWGQGHARATALGVAGMMATLAAAANGQDEIRRPHLVDGLRPAGTPEAGVLAPVLARWGAPASAPSQVPREAAETILSGLSYSHRAGTARTACEQVFDPKRCAAFDWLAGKTGTPSFPGDGIALDELQRLCSDPQATLPPRRGAAAAQRDPEMAKRLRAGACGSLKPYKWYVAAYRRDGASTGPWTKVIAVLSERNWVQKSGQIHGVGDHGPNPSAEIALQIAGRQVGLVSGSAP